VNRQYAFAVQAGSALQGRVPRLAWRSLRSGNLAAESAAGPRSRGGKREAAEGDRCHGGRARGSFGGFAQERRDALSCDTESLRDLFHRQALGVESVRLRSAYVRSTGVERRRALGEQLDDEWPVLAGDDLGVRRAPRAQAAELGDPLLDEACTPAVVGEDALERPQSFKELVFSHGFSSLAAVENRSSATVIAATPIAATAIAVLYWPVSDLAPFLSRTRTAVLPVDDERQCVDANPPSAGADDGHWTAMSARERELTELVVRGGPPESSENSAAPHPANRVRLAPAKGFAVSAEKPESGAPRVSVQGQIDVATVDVVRRQAHRQIELHGPRLVLDLVRTSFMDSSGLHLIEALRHRTSGQGGALVLVVATYGVRRLLEIAPPPSDVRVVVARSQRDVAVTNQLSLHSG
jgi:anti-anti-sigma factor